MSKEYIFALGGATEIIAIGMILYAIIMVILRNKPGDSIIGIAGAVILIIASELVHNLLH